MRDFLSLHPARKLTAGLAVMSLAGAAMLTAAPQDAAVAATSEPVVTVGSAGRTVTGVNIRRTSKALVLYTPARGASTRTNRYGTEIAVSDGKVTKVQSTKGDMVIPSSGYVLSGNGTAGSWLASHAKVGTAVTRSDSTTSTSSTTPPPPATQTTPPPPATQTTPPPPTTTQPAPAGDPFLTTLQSVPGLTHYYPLDAEHGAQDLVGNVDGSLKGTGVTFSSTGATFTGSGYIELPDNDDFSVATKGGLTVLVDLTVSDWHGKGASEYVHWMGKGTAGAHEWTFRHYVQGGTGEASSRQGRVSFYHFNPGGGLGAGSYFQDSMDTSEHVIESTADMKQVQMNKDGSLRDTDALSGYSVVPKNTTTPVRIGSRGDNTGFLVGKIRRVAFFNRVLTPAETSRLATAARQ